MVEHPHAEDRQLHPLVVARYAGLGGLMTQCCHCRLMRRADDHSTWDWVPSVLDEPPDTISHGLCPPCFRHYYPELVEAFDRHKAAEREQEPH